MKLGKTIIFTIAALVAATVAYVSYDSGASDEHLHYHAGFRVYIDGQRQDYSDYIYMNFVPCSEHNEGKSAAEEQMELAHLHDGVGDVVHVHRPGAKWGDLFRNIGVELPGDIPMLKEPIEANSSVVFNVGKVVENPEKVSLEHIKEVEAKSELCGSGE